MTLSTSQSCPVCDGPKTTRHCIVHKTEIKRCLSCGLGWWDFNQTDLDGFYEKDYYFSREEGKGYSDYTHLRTSQMINARNRIKAIRRMVPRATTVLDIGCGLGYFIEQARNDGFMCTGYEVSKFAAEHVRQRLGIPVRENGLSTIAERFDVVTAWDVLEHVAEQHQFVAECAHRVNPDGIIVFMTGNFNSFAAKISGRHWHLFNLPEHLYFHTPASMRVLGQKAGLEICSLRHPAAYYPVSYLRERIRRKLHLPLPETFLDRLKLPINLHDIMEVTYRVKPQSGRA